MHDLTKSIDYRGYRIEERSILSAGGAVGPNRGGKREVIPAVPVKSTQLAIVKVLLSGEVEEVYFAVSEEDARRWVDEQNT